MPVPIRVPLQSSRDDSHLMICNVRHMSATCDEDYYVVLRCQLHQLQPRHSLADHLVMALPCAVVKMAAETLFGIAADSLLCYEFGIMRPECSCIGYNSIMVLEEESALVIGYVRLSRVFHTCSSCVRVVRHMHVVNTWHHPQTGHLGCLGSHLL